MKLYRARIWRKGSGTTPPPFDPLDSAGSVRGPTGWRFNDLHTEILYAAEVESLAVLEVAVRPGLDTIREIIVATIEVPDNAVVGLNDLGIVLPTNWNARPATDDSRTIARQFVDAVGRWAAITPCPIGVRVPSVLSVSDFNVLLDPARKHEMSARITARLPFDTLRARAT